MNALRHTLKQDAFWQINKALVADFGIEGAVILTDLIEKFYHYTDRQQTIKRDGKEWFFFTAEDIEKTFKIGYKSQKRILTELRDKGLIETRVMQMPAKLHIHLCERNILKFLNEASIAQTAKLELPKGQNLFDQKGKTIINNISNNNSLFNNKDNVEVEFITEFQKLTGRKFKMVAKAKTQFKARIKDGYTYKDMLRATANAMTDDYHKESNFNYLTPEFITRADKLEKYLNYQKKKPADSNDNSTISM